MKNNFFYIVLVLALTLVSCSSTKNKDNRSSDNIALKDHDRKNLSLLNQIRRIPGITVQSGAPRFFNKTNSLISNTEPLYILDGYVVGNSFAALNDLVNPVDVKNIEVLDGSDASLYGTRAANGVIKITTRS